MYKKTLLIVLILLSIFDSNAQCAMCRVVAESSKNAGSTIADGLNTGILYLMAFPYLLLIFGVIAFFLRSQKSN